MNALVLNRMTSNRVKYSDTGTWKWLKRQHELSATGAILKSTYKAWNDGSGEPAGDSLHHSWGQDGKHIQNTDTNGSSFGKPWHWAGAANNHGGPLQNPNADTASQAAYNVGAAGGAGTPSRWSYVNPTTSGDSRELWGQGQPEAKDSVNDWRYGKKSKAASGVFPEIESRFAYMGTVAPTDLDRATDAREKGRVSFFGSGYSYAGSSPRVTSEKIGRDINPLGRGGGAALVGGMLNLGEIAPTLPGFEASSESGSSVNNACCEGVNEPFKGWFWKKSKEKVLSKNGRHTIDLDCWLRWRRNNDPADLATCPPCPALFICPSANEFYSDIGEALDKYCACLPSTNCHNLRSAKGRKCYPPEDCIDCDADGLDIPLMPPPGLRLPPLDDKTPREPIPWKPPIKRWNWWEFLPRPW